MTNYLVVKIEEQMYGCEEIPDGQPVLCDVLLRDADGREQYCSMPDDLLYQRDIREGDTVVLDPSNGLIRV